MKQRLHANLAPIDLLTREELEQVMHSKMDADVRERYRGLDTARIPAITNNGNGGTIQVASLNASDGVAGPEQGDVWLLRRALIVSSFIPFDSARYILYRGSTPSDLTSGYLSKFILDAQTSNGGSNAVVITPAVPASGVNAQNANVFPAQVVINANGATITAVNVNGQQVGTGAGTYLVPSGGTISITYTVATPTWTWTNPAAYALGQLVGVSYNAPNKGVILHPGEQIYAQVFGSNSNAQYSLIGEAIRCPAEMKGKLLA